MPRLAVLLCLFTSAASAQTIPQDYFESGLDCYGRTYSADHLAAHPDQQVAAMSIGVWDTRYDGDRFLLLVNVRLRDSRDVLTGLGYCAVGPVLDCLLEGDAGRFTVTPQDDSLLVQPTGDGMHFEAAVDFVTLSATTGDDRAFRLDPLPPGQCPDA
jgi:hypothetical protein